MCITISKKNLTNIWITFSETPCYRFVPVSEQLRWVALCRKFTLFVHSLLFGQPCYHWLEHTFWITLFTNKPVDESDWSQPVVRTPTLRKHQMNFPACFWNKFKKRIERCLVSSRYADCCSHPCTLASIVTWRTPAGRVALTVCLAVYCDMAGTVPESSS